MRKILALILAALMIIISVSCSFSPKDDTPPEYDSGNVLSPSESEILFEEENTADSTDDVEEPITLPGKITNLQRDIYLCTDVYRTADTPTHGSGIVSLPLAEDVIAASQVEILLCDDGCESIDVISRTSEGYARTHEFVFADELDGEHTVLKYTRIPNPQMEESLKKQGVYDEVMAQFRRNYFYLIVLDDTHYVYVQLEGIEGTECASNEEALADEIVRNAKVSFEAKK